MTSSPLGSLYFSNSSFGSSAWATVAVAARTAATRSGLMGPQPRSKLERLHAEHDVIATDSVEPEQQTPRLIGGDVDFDDPADRAAGQGPRDVLLGGRPGLGERSRLHREALDLDGDAHDELRE